MPAAEARSGAEAGLRLAGTPWSFWAIRGYWAEGRQWLEEALSRGADAPQGRGRAEVEPRWQGQRTMTMTPEQVAFFQTFGYLPLRRAFDAEEMAAISREFDALLSEERQGRPFPGERRQTLYALAEKNPLLTQLVTDDRIYGTVEQLLGPGFIWLCSEGNLYVGDTSWHPDGSRLAYPPMKVSLYLDSLSRETGCLRVIPGSHRLPFHDALKPIANLGVRESDLPSVPLETEPGDVYFLNMNLWHASFGGEPGRRHMALNFVPEPTCAEHDAALAENHRIVLRLMGELQHSQPGRVFEDAFLRSDHPRIRRLTARWVQLGLP